MTERRRTFRHLVATALLAAAVLTPACSAQAESSPPTASVDDPAQLTDDQAELLAAMPFKNYAAGITGFEGQLLGGSGGDMHVVGWIDFTHRSGVATAVPAGAPPIQIVWDSEQIAFLDRVDAAPATTPPALPLAEGAWQTVTFDPQTSELTRLLAALLLLSSDRPDNPLLVKQNGARYLGGDDVDGAMLERFSGPAAGGGGGGVDLGTQYWLDEDGVLVRFGLRADASGLTTIDFGREAQTPESLPTPAEAGHDG